jgi:surface antigen
VKPKGLVTVALVLVPAVSLGLVFSILLLFGSSTAADASCEPAEAAVDGDLPASIDGYSGEQLVNAALIINAGKALGLPLKGQIIAVMTAMGESGLRVLDHGDTAGPDSRGLFQQRDNAAWGTYQDRMNPTTSSTNFMKTLQKVEGWEQLEPTLAAHKVQHNADPYHYERYWLAAVRIVSAVAAVKVSPESGSCAIPGSSGAGDDLPWKNGATWADAGTDNPASHSPLGMFNRECTDFALWRVNQQLGSTSSPFKVLNSTFRPDGQNLGSAVTWKAGWNAKGWPTGNTPRVGAVVWYAPGIGGADPKFGHVAVVKAINKDGTYLEEGYNGNPSPEDHKYYTRHVNNDVPSAFLYMPGMEEKP